MAQQVVQVLDLQAAGLNAPGDLGQGQCPTVGEVVLHRVHRVSLEWFEGIETGHVLQDDEVAHRQA